MFKKLLIGVLAAILVVATGASVYTTLAASLVDSTPAAENAAVPVELAAVSSPALSASETVPVALTDEEIAGLLYMYEEEKLARDVYNALYTIWNQPTFANIAASEQKHMDAVNTVLDRYGITAPVSGVGSFTDSTLQALYNDLLATGRQSLGDALKVGAAIEEMDILDLNNRLAQTTNPDIRLLYSNLMNGSFNHLRSFVSALKQQTGETYQPQYLNADLYNSILAGSNGAAQGAGMGNRGARGRGHGNSGSGIVPDPMTKGSQGRGYRGGR